jgi:hypothetical protein
MNMDWHQLIEKIRLRWEESLRHRSRLHNSSSTCSDDDAIRRQLTTNENALPTFITFSLELIDFLR